MTNCCSTNTTFGPFTPRDQDFFMFDYYDVNQASLPALNPGETISSATWTSTAFAYAEDVTPASLSFNSPAITGPADRPATVVQAELFPSGTAGVTYLITCIVTTSIGRIIEQSGLADCVDIKLSTNN